MTERATIMNATIASTALVAIVFMGPAVAQQQQLTGTAQYCLKGATGPIKCEFQNRADCERAKPSNSSDECILRSEAQGTVGGRSAPRETSPAPGTQKD